MKDIGLFLFFGGLAVMILGPLINMVYQLHYKDSSVLQFMLCCGVVSIVGALVLWFSPKRAEF